MSVSRRRVRAIFRKELREYRRNGSIVWAMSIIPLLFILPPAVRIFGLPASSAGDLRGVHILLYMLGIPALSPALVASYAVVGERQQGTLEPVLTTPIRREEFLLGKALAVAVPSLGIAYAVYALLLACIELFAQRAVASAVVRGPDLLALVLFAPLLAGWSIWVGFAISTRMSDVRVAQQLSLLACVPPVLVTSFIAYNLIHASLRLALVGAAVLLIADRIGWRVMSTAFDPERLVTGNRRSRRGRGANGPVGHPE